MKTNKDPRRSGERVVRMDEAQFTGFVGRVARKVLNEVSGGGDGYQPWETYRFRRVERRLVQDDYREGEVGSAKRENLTGQFSGLTGTTANELVDRFIAQAGIVDREDDIYHTGLITVYAGDHTPFIIIDGGLVDESGNVASDEEIESWKRGERKLFQTDYDCEIIKVTRLDLEMLRKEFPGSQIDW